MAETFSNRLYLVILKRFDNDMLVKKSATRNTIFDKNKIIHPPFDSVIRPIFIKINTRIRPSSRPRGTLYYYCIYTARILNGAAVGEEEEVHSREKKKQAIKGSEKYPFPFLST